MTFASEDRALKSNTPEASIELTANEPLNVVRFAKLASMVVFKFVKRSVAPGLRMIVLHGANVATVPGVTSTFSV